MQKSVSQPNLVAYHGAAATKGGMRKSISTNALHELTVMDAVIMTKAPVNQAVSCLVSAEFPEHILSGKVEVDKELVSCLMSPCEAPSVKQEQFVSNTLNRNYLQLAVENETVQERYLTWLRRIRKKKDDEKYEPCPQ